MAALIIIFGQAFLVALSGALMPGPLLTYNIQLSYKKGVWSGPLLIAGHGILEAILLIGLMFGLGDLIKLPATQTIIGFLGGLMLIWMGSGLLRSEKSASLNLSHLDKGETAATTVVKKKHAPLGTNLPPVLAGIIISLSNPYWSLWWVVIGIAQMTQAFTVGWPGVLFFFAGHLLADLVWYSLISVLVVGGRAWFSERFYRGLMLACGIFLIFLAGKFIFDAIKLSFEPGGIFHQAVDLFRFWHKFV